MYQFVFQSYFINKIHDNKIQKKFIGTVLQFRCFKNAISHLSKINTEAYITLTLFCEIVALALWNKVAWNAPWYVYMCM